jgi:CBS-domain-containing membrane protein
LGELVQEVVTCEIDVDLDKVIRLMRDHAVRRIPLMEEGRPVGLITLDDLVVGCFLKSRPRITLLECSAQCRQDCASTEPWVAAESTSVVLREVFRVIAGSVSAGQIKEVRGQPDKMKTLFRALLDSDPPGRTREHERLTSNI